jgi:YNFM family putative membrane transporter
LRDPGLVQLFLVPFLLMGGFIATYNYLSYRLAAPPFSLPESLSGAIFLVYLFGGPSSAWFGRIGARHGRALWLILSLGLMLAGLGLTASSGIVPTILGITALTCGFFGGHSIASGWVGHRAKVARAQAASLYLFAYYAGSSLFGWAGGFFWSRWGWPGVMGLVTGLILIAMGLAYNLGRGERRESVADAAV